MSPMCAARGVGGCRASVLLPVDSMDGWELFGSALQRSRPEPARYHMAVLECTQIFINCTGCFIVTLLVLLTHEEDRRCC